MLGPILSRLSTLLAFVIKHPVEVDLRPETEDIEAMTRAYYRGVDHLQNAHKAFLSAKDLWRQLHED